MVSSLRDPVDCTNIHCILIANRVSRPSTVQRLPSAVLPSRVTGSSSCLRDFMHALEVRYNLGPDRLTHLYIMVVSKKEFISMIHYLYYTQS